MTPDKPVSYTLKDVPADLWRELRHLSIAREQTLRETLLGIIREAVETARKASV